MMTKPFWFLGAITGPNPPDVSSKLHMAFYKLGSAYDVSTKIERGEVIKDLETHEK